MLSHRKQTNKKIKTGQKDVWHGSLMMCEARHATQSTTNLLIITLANKKIFFQKSLNVKMILEYIKFAEPKYALSFFELALVFEI